MEAFLYVSLQSSKSQQAGRGGEEWDGGGSRSSRNWLLVRYGVEFETLCVITKRSNQLSYTIGNSGLQNLKLR